MTTIAFTLSMPTAMSWNGRWSGQGNLYAIVERTTDLAASRIVAGQPYLHRFSDGWLAKINVQRVDKSEAKRVRKESQGFCGYEWMVRSIKDKGKIEA